VTGVANVANVDTAVANNSSQKQISALANSSIHPTTVALNSATTNTTNSTRSPVSLAAIDSAGANNSNSNLKALSVSVRVGKSSLHPGDTQTLTTTVVDKINSTNVIAGASVSERITNPSGIYKNIEGTTDDLGSASYSWTVDSHDTSGTYKVTVDVSAPNYDNYSTSKTFQVTPISSSASDNTLSTSENPNNDNNPATISDNSNTNDNTQNELGIGNVGEHGIRSDSLSKINSGNGISSGSVISSSSDNNIGAHHKRNGGESSVDQNVNGLAQKK
jgi:hypothetical protein